jgi:acetylornithine deacetylase/succinyl-diaminopimelate desuccinylase-like protein
MIETGSALDVKIAAAAAELLPLATRILREAIRIPADYVPGPNGAPARVAPGDPQCGLSNHEGPRIEFLRRTLVEIGAVRSPGDVEIDAFGNLHWVLEDPADGVPAEEKRVIYLDGHCDTVRALRQQWSDRTGGGIDAYDGEVDPARVDRAFLRDELGWVPSDTEWRHLLFGRGSADQLGGVTAQIVASKILLELAPEGALKGCRIHSYATVAEEDNDGGGPMWIVRHVLPGAGPERIPDVVILTEGTGDSREGALGIYRGQRGRMQIEVSVTGRSCHGSMPAEGLNPLEFGSAIISEAAERFARGEGFLDHPFLGRGTRTASHATLETPSDCAVPERFTFRFDRRLTVGETPDGALADIEHLEAVRVARAAGLRVDVAAPTYELPTWRGFVPGNPQVYMGWETPSDHPAIRAAESVYRRVISPFVGETTESGGALRREPRVSRWVFSTDGVGFPVPTDDRTIEVSNRKRWVRSGAFKHPAMFGLGPGIEQNTHKIGECVDVRELQHAIAFLARFPGVFAAGNGG